ncbi:hypothetical protein GCM10028801_00470 [Nocardioides maradonensis]
MTQSLLRTVDPSVVDADPFWATVVARHPYGSYVLLPPDPPPAELPPDRAEAAATAVAETSLLLQRYVEAADPTATPAVSWRGSPGARRLVARTALICIGREAGTDLAAAIGVGLGTRGWALRPRRGPALATLALRSPDHDQQPVEVDLAIGEGATVLSVTADPAVTSWR